MASSKKAKHNSQTQKTAKIQYQAEKHQQSIQQHPHISSKGTELRPRGFSFDAVASESGTVRTNHHHTHHGYVRGGRAGDLDQEDEPLALFHKATVDQDGPLATQPYSNEDIHTINENVYYTRSSRPEPVDYGQHHDQHHDRHHDLSGIGTQFDYLSSRPQQQVSAIGQTSLCPYHARLSQDNFVSSYEGDVLSTYLDGNIGESYAVYYQPDGSLSTQKGCTCLHATR